MTTEIFAMANASTDALMAKTIAAPANVSTNRLTKKTVKLYQCSWYPVQTMTGYYSAFKLVFC